MSREMKDSGVEWIGEIPVDWQMMPSGSLFSSSKEKATVNDEKLSATQLYGVIPQKLFEENETRQVVSVNKNFESLKRVSANSFVISLRSFQGGIELSRYNGAISAAYTVLAPNSKINHEYYKYLFKSQRYIQAIQSTIIESVREGKSISYADFKLIKLPLLSFNEQGKIANFLDEKIVKIDSIIENTKSTIDDYKLLKQSIITEAVTKGLDKNVEMKDSGIEWIGEIPKHWKTLKIKHAVRIRDEKNTFDSSKDCFIGLENISSQSGKYIITETKYEDGINPTFKEDDILFGKLRPYLAKCLRVNFSGFCTSELLVIKEFIGNKRFLQLYLLSPIFIDQVNSSTYGAKMPRANWSFIKELEIPIPPIEEQNSIEKYFDEKLKNIDFLIEQKENLVVDLLQYKKSLICEYVTGKKEVE